MNRLRNILTKWHFWLFAGVILTATVASVLLVRPGKDGEDGQNRNIAATATGDDDDQHVEFSTAAVTFNRDIAPIVFKQCSSCHHAGEPVPFHLLSYDDFKKRGKLIKEVVQKRHMPPWMPARGVMEFEGQRLLSDDEIALISKWVDDGAREGQTSERPTPPQFEEGWTLGKPDHVAKMGDAFSVPADGKDIYRNFVIPLGLAEGKWIKAVQVRTPESKAVHHGFVFVDSTGGVAKEKDSAEPGVGYAGMDPGTGVFSPPGHCLSWQPGKQASKGSEEMSWWLPRHSDLVLQMHIRPTGKEEQVQAEVAFYFSDKVPSLYPSVIMLRSVDIDIPAGAKDYAVESSYVVPVDLQAISVLPHAHYLGRKVSAWATLPDGERQSLMRIDDWNFDWQGDYRYAKPIELAAGTRISMRWEYDNSADNLRNPNQPPKRVTYGLNSSDEMAELYLQVLARDQTEKAALESDYQENYAIPDMIAVARALLTKDPTNPERIVKMGVAILARDEVDEAIALFNQALTIQPSDAKARYHLGHAFAAQNDPRRAVEEWKEVIRIDPRHFRAHNNLGYWYFTQRDFAKAEEHLLTAVAINENDLLTRVNLARLYAARGEWTTAEAELREAIKIEPRNEMVKDAWHKARSRLTIK